MRRAWRAACEAGEFTFDVPARVPSGAVRLDLANNGEQPHHSQVLRLHDDATVDDLVDALATGEPAAALEVGTFVGGTALVSAGERSDPDAVLDLRSGTHVLWCFLPDADGVPHVAHGMVRPFEVVDGDGASEPPDADVDVGLVDYRFELPESIDPAETLTVSNRASNEAHEMVVARLEDGAEVRDVLAALDGGQPLPATGVGGMQAIAPGDSQQLQLDLGAGRYAVFCAVPSPDGAPHYRRGMVAELTVP